MVLAITSLDRLARIPYNCLHNQNKITEKDTKYGSFMQLGAKGEYEKQ